MAELGHEGGLLVAKAVGSVAGAWVSLVYHAEKHARGGKPVHDRGLLRRDVRRTGGLWLTERLGLAASSRRSRRRCRVPPPPACRPGGCWAPWCGSPTAMGQRSIRREGVCLRHPLAARISLLGANAFRKRPLPTLARQGGGLNSSRPSCADESRAGAGLRSPHLVGEMAAAEGGGLQWNLPFVGMVLCQAVALRP